MLNEGHRCWENMNWHFEHDSDLGRTWVNAVGTRVYHAEYFNNRNQWYGCLGAGWDQCQCL